MNFYAESFYALCTVTLTVLVQSRNYASCTELFSQLLHPQAASKRRPTSVIFCPLQTYLAVLREKSAY